MKLFIAGTLILLSGPVQAAETIDQVLQTSAADWSRGDLRAFMQSYEDALGTVFITRSGPIQGADNIRAYYAAHYGPASHATMGQLALSVLQERPLAPDYALVTGRFQLNAPQRKAAMPPASSPSYSTIPNKAGASPTTTRHNVGWAALG